MKILYAGTLTPNDTALHRLWALERLGHTVVPLTSAGYESANPLLRKLLFRLTTGPGVDRFNAEILRLAAAEKPDLLWADKLLWLRPQTLWRLRAMGIATVSYMIDNAFGPRRDPGWRLYMRCIPCFDLHVTQRDQNLVDYRKRGARDVLKIQTAYEPTLHYPPPPGWNDQDRDRGVSFIGTPYDRRGDLLTRLWRDFDIPVAISGNEMLWRRALSADAFAALFRGGELYGAAYREGIWRSKINLSFITHGNQDEFAHKSFEIAGCGSFLLAERTPGHTDRFAEDKEAVFFSTLEECAAQIRCWLPDEVGRARIAAAGQARASRHGYHNDGQVGLILERILDRIEGNAREPEGRRMANLRSV